MGQRNQWPQWKKDDSKEDHTMKGEECWKQSKGQLIEQCGKDESLLQ